MKSKEIKKFRENYTKYDKDCVFEGYRLAVRFDEKDMVKKHGGRWDATEETWWMPEKHLLNDAGVGSPSNGSLIRDVLNDHKMVMGQYGNFKGKKSIMDNKSHEGFILRKDELAYVVTWYPNQDAVEFVGASDTSKWYTVETGKTRWDELVKEGYNRVENS